MSDRMEFPVTFEKFAKEYGFKDDKEVYTNGSELIPIFRVKQWLEHDNKLRIIETDTAYECGKYANKWIPIDERMPEHAGLYLLLYERRCGIEEMAVVSFSVHAPDQFTFEYEAKQDILRPIAWLPITPYKQDGSDKE